MLKTDFSADGARRPRDVITADEQAAIDAFPASKVTRCDRGESSIDPARPKSIREMQESNWRRYLRINRFLRAEVNRQLRSLVMQGLTDRQIADELGVHPNTVGARRRKYQIPCARDVAAGAAI